MMRPAIERWDSGQHCFVGLDLIGFWAAIEASFDVQTDDGQSWRLDRVIGARLWEKACEPGILPKADWDVQLRKRREAERQKEMHNFAAVGFPLLGDERILSILSSLSHPASLTTKIDRGV